MKNKKLIRAVCLLLAVLCLCSCAAPQPQLPSTQNTTAPSDTQAATGTTAPTAEDPTVPPTTQATTVPPTEETLPPAITAASFEELEALAAGDTLKAGDTLRLVGDMEITSQIVFTLPISLSVEAAVTCTYPITFETFETGSLEVTVAEGIDTSALDIRFDAPNCEVWWLSGSPYISEQQAAEQMNVLSYNGTDLRNRYGLGGTGEKEILSFSLMPEDNSSLESPLVWQVEGNTVYLTVSYLTPESTLRNATVRMEMSDGTTLLEELNLTADEQSYRVTDGSGRSRVYKLITQRITYNLPVFYIEIEGGEEVTSREEYLSATLRIDTQNAVGDFPGLETTAISIRGRGHFSWNFDKKPYRIRFDKKTSVLGMSASKNWVLLSNYLDRSLIQNYVALEMGKVMTNIPYHSTQYPVDVFVNGSYRGVYTFGEQLEAKKERIPLEESYEEVDTDYLLEVGGYDEGDEYLRDYFHAGTLLYIAVKHPESDQLTREQLDYLISYVQAADEAVRNLSGYEDYIDVDSLIDWVILHELTYNLDCCFRRSCYLIKEKGGKLKMGPIWDFDLAFGSFYRYEPGDWATVGEEGGYVGVTWMNYLKEDEAFMARFKARWNEIKEPLLEKALSSVENMAALVAPSADMNFVVWDILGQSLSAQPSSHKVYDTYEKMIQRLTDFLHDRYSWMDSQLN